MATLPVVAVAASWFGMQASLRFVPFEQFSKSLPEQFRQAAFEHIARSHSVSIEKARRVLGYEPRHTALQAVAEAVEWLRREGRLGEGIPPVSVPDDRDAAL